MSKEQVHYIYEINFLIPGWQGKYYIGKRSTYNNPYTEKYAGSGDICKRYFKKYGKINGVTYEKIILEFNSSKEQNAQREKDIIGDCYITDHRCVNMKPGGGCITKLSPKYSRSIEFKRKLHNDRKGKILSTTKNLIKFEKGNIPWNKGKTYKIGERLEPLPDNWNSWHKKTVYQYDLQGNFIKSYDSVKSAANENGFIESGIAAVCRGERKTHKKFKWSYGNNIL